MAVTYLRSRDSGATPLRWGPAAALHPPGDVTRGGGGPPGGPTLRPGKGPCHHGAGPPPADAAAGLRWRGPAGPAHSPSQTKAWKVACIVALTVDCDRD